jgi:hypothetical protein
MDFIAGRRSRPMPTTPPSHVWDYLKQLSVACAILVFIATLLRSRLRGNPHSLDKLISKLLAGSAIPTGVFLIICAFKTDLMAKLTDLSLYLAAAGLALLYVSVKEISEGW